MSTPASLTARGRVVLLLGTVLLTIALTWALVKAVDANLPQGSPIDTATPASADPSDGSSPGPTDVTPSASISATPSTDTSSSPASESSQPASKPSTSAQSSPPASAEPEPTETMVISKTPASGKYLTSTLTKPATQRTNTTHSYVVKVETTVGQDANGVATQLHAVLTDSRGWQGFKGHSFTLVPESEDPEFTIYLASPTTVDKLCAPATPHRTWNCRVGSRVVLNIDRWQHATPTWSDRPIAEYRAYMLNHEVGHYIGLGHVPCPGKGQPAPVMMQQSIRLGGCQINAWPQP